MLKTMGRYAVCCMVLLGVLMLVAGCASEGNQAILDLVRLQMRLVAEYGGSNMAVELEDGNTLGVTCARCPSGGLDRDLGAREAREIAEFVCENYRSMERIDRVWVAFGVGQDGFMADTAASLTYSFEKGELGCGNS